MIEQKKTVPEQPKPVARPEAAATRQIEKTAVAREASGSQKKTESAQHSALSGLKDSKATAASEKESANRKEAGRTERPEAGQAAKKSEANASQAREGLKNKPDASPRDPGLETQSREKQSARPEQGDHGNANKQLADSPLNGLKADGKSGDQQAAADSKLAYRSKNEGEHKQSDKETENGHEQSKGGPLREKADGDRQDEADKKQIDGASVAGNANEPSGKAEGKQAGEDNKKSLDAELKDHHANVEQKQAKLDDAKADFHNSEQAQMSPEDRAAAASEKLKNETELTPEQRQATAEQKENWKHQENDPRHVHGNSYVAAAESKGVSESQQAQEAKLEEANQQPEAKQDDQLLHSDSQPIPGDVNKDEAKHDDLAARDRTRSIEATQKEQQERDDVHQRPEKEEAARNEQQVRIERIEHNAVNTQPADSGDLRNAQHEFQAKDARHQEQPVSAERVKDENVQSQRGSVAESMQQHRAQDIQRPEATSQIAEVPQHQEPEQARQGEQKDDAQSRQRETEQREQQAEDTLDAHRRLDEKNQADQKEEAVAEQHREAAERREIKSEAETARERAEAAHSLTPDDHHANQETERADNERQRQLHAADLAQRAERAKQEAGRAAASSPLLVGEPPSPDHQGGIHVRENGQQDFPTQPLQRFDTIAPPQEGTLPHEHIAPRASSANQSDGIVSKVIEGKTAKQFIQHSADSADLTVPIDSHEKRLSEGSVPHVAASTECDVREDATLRSEEYPDNPIDRARSCQSELPYGGVDNWELTTLEKGSLVYGGMPGQTAFYTDIATIRASGLRSEELFTSLQVAPHPIYGFRQAVQAYRVTDTIKVPSSSVAANPQFGSGGGKQYFIDKFENVLAPVQLIHVK